MNYEYWKLKKDYTEALDENWQIAQAYQKMKEELKEVNNENTNL